MQLFISLLFTVLAIAFIFFLAWFMTRFVASRGTPGLLGGKQIRVIERVAVTKENCILLVEICGKYSVIGATSQGMTVLRELTDEEAALVSQPQAEKSGKQSFADIFKEALDTTLPEGRIKGAVEKLLRGKGDKREDTKAH